MKSTKSDSTRKSSKSKGKSKPSKSPEEIAATAERIKEKVDALSASIAGRIERLAELLAQGRTEEFKEFLRFCGRFHRYSYNNSILIMLQAPQAEFVAGYRAWQAMGRNVRKGEKAIAILAPRLVRDDDAPPQADGRPAKKLVGFTYTSVFGDHQTEGDPIPDSGMTVKGGDASTMALLERLIGRCPLPVRWAGEGETLGAAHGWTDGKEIVMVRSRCEAEPHHALRVFFHEWGHAALHFGADRKDTTREQRELEADSVAYVLCAMHGVEAGEGVRNYLTGWKATPEGLKASLHQIQKAVKTVMDAVEVLDGEQGQEEAVA